MDITDVAHPNLHHIHHLQHEVAWHLLDGLVQVFWHLVEEHLSPLLDTLGCLLFVSFNIIVLVPNVHRVEVF